MQKIFPFTILFVFCLLKVFSFSGKPGQLYFNGHTKGRVDSVKVRFCRDFLFNDLGGYYFKVSIDAKGKFSFTMDNLDHPAKMDFEIYGDQNTVLSNFVGEPGDSICFDIDNRFIKSSYSFRGRGATKYQCVLKINEQQIAERQSADSTTHNPNSAKFIDFGDPKNAHRMFVFYKNRIASKDKILNCFKKRTSSAAGMLIEADFRGYYQGLWQMQLGSFYYQAKDEVQKEKVIQLANRYDMPVDTSMPYIKSLSQFYTLFLIQKSVNRIYCKKNNYCFFDLYHQIRSDYTGLLREKALMSCLFDPRNRKDSDQADYDSCLADAYQLISTQYIKEAIRYELSVLKKGTPVCDFSFPDTGGGRVTRSDLKGKVILIDFWGTGCGACIKFARNFDRFIQPLIPTDSPFVYLSVNSDADKNLWMASLQKGVYSPKKCLDVYTEGLGDYHPMLLFYRVQYNPFLLLVDKKGNIYARISPGSEPEDIKKIILEAINEN